MSTGGSAGRWDLARTNECELDYTSNLGYLDLTAALRDFGKNAAGHELRPTF